MPEESEAVRDARRFRASEEVLANLRGSVVATNAPFAVWPENVPALNAFLAVDSQWRVVPIGGGLAPTRPLFLGLDYAAVRVGLEAAGITITPALWADLRVLEDEARKALNEASR